MTSFSTNSRINVVAYHLEKQLDLKQWRKELNYPLRKREGSFLLYEINENAYLYIKNYGSIVFFNCDVNTEDQILKTFSIADHYKQQLPKETFIVKKGTELEVDFGKITIDKITMDIAHIIMLNLAQTVALTHYVNATSALNESTSTYMYQLENDGSIRLSKKKMRVFIGKTMNLKNSISENLFIFDSSDLAWSKAHLSDLDERLKDELDIVKRHQSLQFSLDVVKENLDLFQGILQHKYSSMLEWIIIILILFEVVQVFI